MCPVRSVTYVSGRSLGSGPDAWVTPKTWVTLLRRTDFRAVRAPESPDRSILNIIHKAHQPDVVVHFFDADGLTGERLCLRPLIPCFSSTYYKVLLFLRLPEVYPQVWPPVFVALAFLSRFISEVEFGFLVYDEWPDEAIRGSGTRDVHGYRQNACYTLLQIENIG